MHRNIKIKNNKKNILYYKSLFLTIILLLTTYSSFASADNSNANYNQITQTYSFDTPHINQVTINGKFYDRMMMRDCPESGNPREPKLPKYGVHLLLPPATEVKNIDVIPGERVFLGLDFNIEPVGEPVRLSDVEPFSDLIQEELIYNSNHPFPDTLFSEIGINSFRGYKILVIMLHPVQYIPRSGELYYFKDMTVTVSVETYEDKNLNNLFRGSMVDKLEMMRKVDNPVIADRYNKKTIRSLTSNNYDFLILTTDEFEDSFEPLKNAHDAEGIKTEIKTLRDISLFPDSVTPEDIRDFIKDEYLNNGIEYVLLGGDDDIIPSKHLWVEAWDGGETTFMPSDIYYACLDGTYNHDGDNNWGEPTDGNDGGDVDLVAEVYVGRACVGNIIEVANFVSKTMLYMTSSSCSTGKSLMIGEKIYSTPETWGGDCMDEIINGSNAHMYDTKGIPLNQYVIDTLYERDWPDHNWPKSEIISRINTGVCTINHMGHSFYEYSMKLNIDDIPSLKNNDPFFVYSQGCNAGGFDYDDCIAEHLTVKTINAAFAVVMNARSGWAAIGSTNGASQRFHRQFWDAVYGENITEIGKANQDSKEDLLYQINSPCMRWCYFQLNLFGDPTVTFYSYDNNPPIKPARPYGTKKGKIGETYEFKTITTDEDGDMVYYRWDFGDGIFSDWLGPFGPDEEASVSYNWSKTGKYLIKVKARDEHRTESDWSDPLPISMPYNQNSNNLFIQILERLMERFPLLEWFLSIPAFDNLLNL